MSKLAVTQEEGEKQTDDKKTGSDNDTAQEQVPSNQQQEADSKVDVSNRNQAVNNEVKGEKDSGENDTA